MPERFSLGRQNGSRGDETVAVLGLGRFGSAVALELMASDVQVLGVDSSERTVQDMSTKLTHCVRADSTHEDALRQLGIQEFERAVVGIGTSIESNLLTASLLKTLGVDNVWAKAISSAHGRILEQLGVDHVVYPENDMGRRVAHLVMGCMLDFIQFEPDYAMVKTAPPTTMLGKPLSETGVRSGHGVTIVGVKRPGGAFTHCTGETVLRSGDVVIASGLPRAVEKFSELR